jgi:hypothetical protein
MDGLTPPPGVLLDQATHPLTTRLPRSKTLRRWSDRRVGVEMLTQAFSALEVGESALGLQPFLTLTLFTAAALCCFSHQALDSRGRH